MPTPEVDTASKQVVVAGEGANEYQNQHKIIRHWRGCEGSTESTLREVACKSRILLNFLSAYHLKGLIIRARNPRFRFPVAVP